MNLDDYLSWIELKKLCKQYQLDNPTLSPAKIYNLMVKDNIKVPDISMLNQLFKEYNSLRNLFSISL